MKFRPALLLCVAVVIAAVPVWADGIQHPEATTGAFSTDVFHRIDKPTAFDTGGLQSSELRETTLMPGFDADSYPTFAPDLRSYESPSSNLRLWDGDRGWFGHPEDSAPGAVPEPGSLSLLLLGLTGVGLFARRRGGQSAMI